MLLEPGDGLEESLLVSELNLSIAQISSHGETVLDAGEGVDLPRAAGLGDDAFCLVASLGRPDLVGFCTRKVLEFGKSIHNPK